MHYIWKQYLQNIQFSYSTDKSDFVASLLLLDVLEDSLL